MGSIGLRNYKGIKQAYPRIPVPLWIRGFIQLMRPFTLLPVMIGGFTTIILAAAYNGDLWSGILLDERVTIVHAIGTLVLIQIASNSLNQCSDLTEDLINKPYRPIPQGLISSEEARTIAWVLFAIAIFRSTMINVHFGLMCTTIVVMTTLYSTEPVRFKKRLWAGNIVLGVARGSFGFLACFAILYSPFDRFAIAVAIILGVYCTFGWISKDFSDVEGDKKAGSRTLPIVYGNEVSFVFVLTGVILAGMMFVVATLYGIFDVEVMAVGMGAIVWVGYLFWNKEEMWKESEKLENIKLWKHINLMLLFIQLGVMSCYII